MNNEQKAAYDHITPELLSQVTAVLEDAANHKYSVSKIYGAHNQVFKLQEKPESCASCLRKRASALKTWYGEYLLSQTDANLNPNQGNPVNVEINGKPLEGVTVVEEGGNIEQTVFDNLTKPLTEPIVEAGIEVDTILGKAVVSPEIAELAAASANFDKQYLGNPEVQGAVKLTDKDGNAVDAVFNSEDGVKGILNTPDGKTVKPGTYTTADGATYTVQPGGKATLKDDLL